MELNLERLAEHVYRRRQELGLTRAQVQDAGGPSVTRVRTIEEGAGPEPSTRTFHRLDIGLQWEPGSALAVARDGDPTPALPAANSLATDSHIIVSTAELAELLRATNWLVNAHTNSGVELSDAALQVQHATTQLAGRWVTDMLERNRIARTEVPAMLELAFGHLLDSPVDEVPEPERTERLYRRWLTGRPIDLTDQQREAFTERLNRRATLPPESP